MKNILVAFLLGILVISCKKDAKISDTENGISDSLQAQNDSATIHSGESANAFQLEPLDEKAGVGKTIFTLNKATIISFDAQANTGKVNIDGKEYPLNHMDFSENTYEFSGNGITIHAEDGNFQDMVSDCMYGSFPKIQVKFGDKKAVFTNVSVQDCPTYQ